MNVKIKENEYLRLDRHQSISSLELTWSNLSSSVIKAPHNASTTTALSLHVKNEFFQTSEVKKSTASAASLDIHLFSGLSSTKLLWTLAFAWYIQSSSLSRLFLRSP